MRNMYLISSVLQHFKGSSELVLIFSSLLFFTQMSLSLGQMRPVWSLQFFPVYKDFFHFCPSATNYSVLASNLLLSNPLL